MAARPQVPLFRAAVGPLRTLAATAISAAMGMTTTLVETCALVADAARDARDDWWIIGSAAVALHGSDVGRVKDLDLMMSARDAEALLSRVGSPSRAPPASGRFRSQVFGVWSKPPIPVEVFGGFWMAADGGWREVFFSTREPVTVAGARLYVPSAAELGALLRSFGRPKDFARAKLLRGGAPSTHS